MICTHVLNTCPEASVLDSEKVIFLIAEPPIGSLTIKAVPKPVPAAEVLQEQLVQKSSSKALHLPGVHAGGAEDLIDLVAFGSFQAVTVHTVLTFQMADARLDGLLQQLFRSRFSNASAPPGHARGIDEKKLHAPQLLPVGILKPPVKDVFITKVVHVLEVMQKYHQAGADGRTTLIRTVDRAGQNIQPIPANRPGKFHQGWRGSMIWESSDRNKSSCRLFWDDRFGFKGIFCRLSVVLLVKSCKYIWHKNSNMPSYIMNID